MSAKKMQTSLCCSMNSKSKTVLGFVISSIFFVGTGVSTNVWSAVIQCTEDDCFGTEQNDIMKVGQMGSITCLV